jgi:hypothetical protein
MRFAQALAHSAQAIQAHDRRGVGPGGLAYQVLTVSRALRTVMTGATSTKQEAAAWVMHEMPEWRWLMEAALRCRLFGGQEGFDDERTRAAVDAYLAILVGRIVDMPPAPAKPSG